MLQQKKRLESVSESAEEQVYQNGDFEKYLIMSNPLLHNSKYNYISL